MSPITTGYIGCGILIMAIVLRVPVAFASLTIGLAGMLWLLPPQAALQFLAIDIFGQLSSFPLSVILMYVVMGYYAAASGMARRAFEVAYVWAGEIRGGLSMATVMACAAFSAVCGSGAATSATIGKVAYPEMKRYGYDDSLATGCVAAAGTLGPLIPPSGGLVVYALMTEQSIAKCLVSGIIPGLIIAALMAMANYIVCRRNPSLGPPGPATSWTKKLRVLPGLLEIIVLFLFCIGGLYAGLFTPTQSGSVGAVGALLVGVIRRSLSWEKVWSSTKEGLRVSCMILFLITGSIVFGHFLALSTLSFVLVEWAKQLPVPPLVIMLSICLFYIIGGCFMDSLGLMVISIPITAPVIFQLGYNPIWWGLIMCVLAETGAITPPVGVCVYVIKALFPEVPLEKIFTGTYPFLICILVGLALVIAFPILATFIPSHVVVGR